MGKKNRLKAELEDVSSLLEILTVLKDVSSNRFFVYSAKKINYQKLEDIFFKFFDMLSHSADVKCPLVKNNNQGVDILVLTSEQGFMSQLNGRVSSLALEEYQKSSDARLVCVGQKGADKCRSMGMKIEKTFAIPQDGDRGEIVDEIRDYLIDRVKSGKTGKVMIAYVMAKSLGVLRPHAITLLPISSVTEELESAGGGRPRMAKEHFIAETDTDDIVKSLAEGWAHARLFELINDIQIVEAAAQATQLESAIESMTQERKKVMLNFRKSGREELNAAMRGILTSVNMMKAKARAKRGQAA